MRYGAESIERIVVVDAPRRRYRLLLPISPVAGSETAPLRAAYIEAIRRYVNFHLAKADQPTGGNFNPGALVADAAGWFIVP